MTRVIVHAGFHKTGTTSLQDYLKEKRKALGPYLTYYGKADFLQVGAHAGIRGQKRFWWRRRMFRRAFRRFLTGIPDAPIIVLSREAFSGAILVHRSFGGREVARYSDTVIPLANEILRALREWFGQDVRVEFLYSLRDRDTWLANVHGHFLPSINLTDDIAAIRAGFALPPDPEADAAQTAKSLAPAAVHTVWLEDYADVQEGPAAAVLDLAGVPASVRTGLPAAKRRNTGQAEDLRAAFLKIDRAGVSRAALKTTKAALLAAIR